MLYKQELNTLQVTVLIYPCADNILVVHALKLVIQLGSVGIWYHEFS